MRVHTRGQAEPCGSYLPGAVLCKSAVGELMSTESMAPRADVDATLNDSYAPNKSISLAASNCDSFP